MTIKSALICATAIAIALTSFDLRPAAAADGAGIAQQSTDVSAARKRRGYRGNPAVPLAAFGAVMGVVGGIAAANSRRDYYYGAPAYDYGPPAQTYYERPVYQRPAYQGRDYYNRWGGSGGQPGYHGPNVNVPGPTNYGNAAGQNGQQGPGQINPAPGGSN
jgi:hypothetical protein